MHLDNIDIYRIDRKRNVLIRKSDKKSITFK